MRMYKHQKGVTLLELLIGMALSGVVIASSVLGINSINKSTAINMKTRQLEYATHTLISIMASDIRRAGYWASAIDDVGTGANTNPFMDAGDITTTTNCILFSYDLDKDGSLPTLNDANGDERFGYRLSGNTIQARPLSHTTFACDDAADEWVDITDPNYINVTGFTVTSSPVDVTLDTSGTMTIRNITLAITAELTDDASISRTVSKQIRVRNDKFTP